MSCSSCSRARGRCGDRSSSRGRMTRGLISGGRTTERRRPARMTIAVLAAEYSGDRAWSEFARAVGASDDEIESVATALMGSEGADWLDRPRPAFEGQSPQFILAGELNGRNIVRSLMMRLP